MDFHQANSPPPETVGGKETRKEAAAVVLRMQVLRCDAEHMDAHTSSLHAAATPIVGLDGSGIWHNTK